MGDPNFNNLDEDKGSMVYKVVVKRGERIYEGESLSEAGHAFESFKSQSRESDETVIMFRDSEIIRQWYATLSLVHGPMLFSVQESENRPLVIAGEASRADTDQS
jgi:hypothetical protein